MVHYPVETAVNKSVMGIHYRHDLLTDLHYRIFSILGRSNVIFQTERQLAEIIDHGRSHTDNAVQVGESVSAQIQILGACVLGIVRLSHQQFDRNSRIAVEVLACSEILHISDHTLDLKLAAIFYGNV